MKKYAIFLLLLFVHGTFFAAEANFHGDMIAALNESDPRIRAGRIVDALENSSASKCDSAALTVLADEMAKGAIDNSLLSRVTALIKKYPADWKLAALASEAAQLNRTYSSELISSIQQFLMDADFAAITEKESRQLGSLIYTANRQFTADRNIKGSTKFFNQLVNKNPRSALLLKAAAIIQINNCFQIRRTAPNLPGYENLSASDLWKSSLNALADKIGNAEVRNAADADALVAAAFLLKHPEMVELLKKYSARYPENNWSPLSALIANEAKDPALFIESKSIIGNFQGFVAVRNYSAARKLIRNLDEKIRKNLDMILKSAEGRHREVAAVVHSRNFKYDTLFYESQNALVTSIHIIKDKKAIEKILKAAIEDIEKNNARNSSFIICNAIGYVAADLNVKLSDAERLIRRAVKILPEESSFRDSLAWVLFRQGRFLEADREIDSALANCTADLSAATLLLHAAQIKFSCGKIVEARELLEYAKALYQPDKKECHEYDIEIQKKLENLLK